MKRWTSPPAATRHDSRSDVPTKGGCSRIFERRLKPVITDLASWRQLTPSNPFHLPLCLTSPSRGETQQVAASSVDTTPRSTLRATVGENCSGDDGWLGGRLIISMECDEEAATDQAEEAASVIVREPCSSSSEDSKSEVFIIGGLARHGGDGGGDGSRAALGGSRASAKRTAPEPPVPPLPRSVGAVGWCLAFWFNKVRDDGSVSHEDLIS